MFQYFWSIKFVFFIYKFYKFDFSKINQTLHAFCKGWARHPSILRRDDLQRVKIPWELPTAGGSLRVLNCFFQLLLLLLLNGYVHSKLFYDVRSVGGKAILQNRYSYSTQSWISSVLLTNQHPMSLDIQTASYKIRGTWFEIWWYVCGFWPNQTSHI